MQGGSKQIGAVRGWLLKRLFGYGPTQDWSYMDKFSGPSRYSGYLDAYQGLTALCISTIAEAVGMYEPYVYKLDKQGKEVKVPDHPLVKLLNDPNPELQRYQLFEGAGSFTEIFGEFFLYVVPGRITGNPKAIYMLRPDRVGITVDKNTGDVLGYTLNTGNGSSKSIPFTPDEIIHHMRFNPKNPYRGIGTIESALDYIGTEEQISKYTRNFFHNNAGLSGIMNVNGKVSKEAWQKFVRQWRERYEGVDNAGKIMMIRDSEATFTKIGLGLNELDMTNLKGMTQDQVLMMFKVPKGLLGLESGEGLGRASVETLEYIFAKWNIDTKFRRLDHTFQQMLNKYWPKDKGTYFVGHVSHIPLDKQFELDQQKLLTDLIWTRNEMRKAQGLEPMDGGDELRALTTSYPISDDLLPPEPSTPSDQNSQPEDDEPEEDDQEDDQNDQDNQDDQQQTKPKAKPKKKKPTKSIRLKMKKNVVRLILKKSDSKKTLQYTTEQKENYRKRLDKNAEQYEKKYADAFREVLKEQHKRVAQNIAHLKKSTIADPLMDKSDQVHKTVEALTPIVTEIYKTQGQMALEFAGDDESTFELTQAIATAIHNSIQKMAEKFTQETIDTLADTLTEGMINGEGLEALSARVAEVYKEAQDWRTDRVARTESMNATNAASVDAYKLTGYVTALQWNANPDCCWMCDELNGKIVGIDESFVKQGESVTAGGKTYLVDYGDVDWPPIHPNDRCNVIPVTEAA